MSEWEKLVRKLDKLEPGVAGPEIGWLDKRRWTTILSNQKKSTSEEPEVSRSLQPVTIPGDLFYISGECLAVHRKVFAVLGGFYEPYFMYYEDADYSLRAGRAGYPLTRITGVRVYHQPGSSIGRDSFLHQYYLARNHLLFVERLAPMSVKLYEWLRLPKTYIEHLVRDEAGGRSGVRDYLLRRFGKFSTALEQ